LSFEIENTFEESNKGPISPLQLSMDGEILENDFLLNLISGTDFNTDYKDNLC
jgi:hypothetical protein